MSHIKQKVVPPRATHEIDAANKTLGRLATRIATILRGKHKATYLPHIDGGDSVIVTNARQVKLTGKKLYQKVYHRYTGYPGGIRTKQLSKIMEENPSDALRRAVTQMLPNTRLRKGMMKRLHISNE